MKKSLLLGQIIFLFIVTTYFSSSKIMATETEGNICKTDLLQIVDESQDNESTYTFDELSINIANIVVQSDGSEYSCEAAEYCYEGECVEKKWIENPDETKSIFFDKFKIVFSNNTDLENIKLGSYYESNSQENIILHKENIISYTSNLTWQFDIDVLPKKNFPIHLILREIFFIIIFLGNYSLTRPIQNLKKLFMKAS